MTGRNSLVRGAMIEKQKNAAGLSDGLIAHHQ